MSKTPFSKKCEILGKVWVWYKSDTNRSDAWLQFFDWNDVGLPMAYLAMSDMVSIKRDKRHFIDETWTDFCNIVGIDPDAFYDDVQDTFDAARRS